MKRLNQAGAGHLVAVLIGVMVIAIGVIGYRVATLDSTEPALTASSDSSATNQTASIPDSINSPADLEQADAALSDTDLNALDTSQLDSDINGL